MNRLQHILPSGIIAAIGLWVCWISFTQQPAEAFLFPRLISVIFVALSLWTFGKALLGLSKVGAGISLDLAKAIAPGLIISALYIFWAAKTFGFYTSTTAAFFILLTLYDPAPFGDIKAWGKRIIITAVVMAVLYGLFAALLNVYTPRGMFM
ncbi:MAG: tripartite tricarboxylate transporter TctB family protein [Pikeienuella sp.]